MAPPFFSRTSHRYRVIVIRCTTTNHIYVTYSSSLGCQRTTRPTRRTAQDATHTSNGIMVGSRGGRFPRPGLAPPTQAPDFALSTTANATCARHRREKLTRTCPRIASTSANHHPFAPRRTSSSIDTTFGACLAPTSCPRQRRVRFLHAAVALLPVLPRHRRRCPCRNNSMCSSSSVQPSARGRTQSEKSTPDDSTVCD